MLSRPLIFEYNMLFYSLCKYDDKPNVCALQQQILFNKTNEIKNIDFSIGYCNQCCINFSNLNDKHRQPSISSMQLFVWTHSMSCNHPGRWFHGNKLVTGLPALNIWYLQLGFGHNQQGFWEFSLKIHEILFQGSAIWAIEKISHSTRNTSETNEINQII